MTEVLQSPSHFPSPSSSSPSTCAHNNNDSHQHSLITSVTEQREGEGGGTLEEQESHCSRERKEREREREQLSLLTLLVAAFRKSLIGCRSSSSSESKELCSSMDIGFPSNVRHVAHITFDRFNGFLGLPSEFEPEVSRRAPSASANVFGVSTESMQLSFDSRGNSVPTILLMMQRRLYEKGGLQAEGIFRITTENSHEEYVREQLNRGIVPDDVDVHCLAGLIKAWFRELPTGVLDSLSTEQVMQAKSEEDYVQLVTLLPSTEAALLDWAVNLMADVAQLEHLNKMDARNVAVVFAPNMTKMADPLTALVYAVQVMNFLKTLIIKTVREREDPVIDTAPALHLDSSDESGHNSSSEPVNEDFVEDSETERTFFTKDPAMESPPHSRQDYSATDPGSHSYISCSENLITGNFSLIDNCPCEVVPQVTAFSSGHKEKDPFSVAQGVHSKTPSKPRNGPLINPSLQMGTLKINDATGQAGIPLEKGKPTDIVSRINSQTELVEAWR